MFDDYVSVDTTPLYEKSTGSRSVCHLLWGDGVRFASSASPTNGRRRVTARGSRDGWVRVDRLGGQSLLEVYFIDVGQGDGILIKTPGFRHLLIDGGLPRSRQDTGKNAADFVDWKFFRDYGKKTIHLDAMLASHCDLDHYGGLSDLLDVKQEEELDADDVRVDAFYHAGLAWWAKPGGSGRTLGPFVSDGGETFWTRLMGNRAQVQAALGSGTGPKLSGEWAGFLSRVVATKAKNGQPTPIERLGHSSGTVPGFGPGIANEPAIQVLGPVEFDVTGKVVLRRFGSTDSKNTNGVSLLLRVDHGRTRMLLTGDLNKLSQHTLLEDYAGSLLEFQCDVAKACHHGSEDISYKFLQAMRPAATIISSGDNEGFDHPRPSIISASATTGYLQLDDDDDDLVTPLVYSTELARSVDLGSATKLEERDSAGNTTGTLSGQAMKRAVLHLKKTKRDTVLLGKALVVGGLVYGLVNVRTDGDRILCATLDESSSRWRIKSFQSRF